MKIGQLIGDNLVEDGATLQMGIGSIPDAVLSALKGHKDLGIHSEMFSVGVIDLFRRGCVTNNKAILAKNLCEMLEIDYVNNTHIVSLQPTMTAINSCIERAYELIKIAHPDHREALEKAAFERLQCMPAP
ncbi:hypothetical protein MSG28_001433 [Choristoneura fumiferana]|uniref:Uncharacterized protein n=1 Tax=Choristoneura fumiferana TaxID=7141 RepID=A0ACC0KUL5_CHOFU|nr:hypothetical protein MSG28_001433 [Choristoneura fumiferana]